MQTFDVLVVKLRNRSARAASSNYAPLPASTENSLSINATQIQDAASWTSTSVYCQLKWKVKKRAKNDAQPLITFTKSASVADWLTGECSEGEYIMPPQLMFRRQWFWKGDWTVITLICTHFDYAPTPVDVWHWMYSSSATEIHLLKMIVHFHGWIMINNCTGRNTVTYTRRAWVTRSSHQNDTHTKINLNSRSQ